jgi:hypothetical protein
MHKYLNDIGIKSDDIGIFNTERIEPDSYFQQEKDKHSFDSRETWDLGYTSATWLYEHIYMYKEMAGKVVNLNANRYKIPVLHELYKGEWRYTRCSSLPDTYYKEILEYHTEEECIDIIIEYLKYYLTTISEAKLREQELKAYENLQCAFKIYAVIIPMMWW